MSHADGDLWVPCPRLPWACLCGTTHAHASVGMAPVFPKLPDNTCRYLRDATLEGDLPIERDSQRLPVPMRPPAALRHVAMGQIRRS